MLSRFDAYRIARAATLAILFIAPLGCAGGPDDAAMRRIEAANPGYPGIAMGRGRHAVARANFADAEQGKRAGEAVGEFYLAIYDNHLRRDAELAKVRERYEAEAVADRERLVAALKADGATREQIAAIKDGLTHNAYNAMDRQYEAYRPALSPAQKRQVRAWLAEARDKAMIAGSADEKIAVFDVEYRAKINAWLMTQGYDIATAKAAYDKQVVAEAATRAATQQAAE
jgi:hypothetical protein